MKKNSFKRVGLGMVQHLMLALAVIIVASIFQTTIIRSLSIYSDEILTYRIDPFDESENFEESDVFADMFYHSVSELVTLVLIRTQMETDATFDDRKSIDITEFVNRREEVSDCPITAVYYLRDLIKWEKYGIKTREVVLTKREFVNYFPQDDLLDIRHFYLDEDSGILRYSGELTGDYVRTPDGWQAAEGEYSEDEIEERNKLIQVYQNLWNYNADQLINMAFSYVASHMDKPISITEENGVEKVHLQMLENLFATCQGTIRLTDLAGNWIDYCKLENNLIDTIQSLSYNYELYENGMKLYQEGNTNVRYLIRIPRDRSGESAGKKEEYLDYTNLPVQIASQEDGEIDNYFQDLGQYLTYSADDISCGGTVRVSDDDIYNMVQTHEYAYPEGTRIWVGVDKKYAVTEECFTAGKQVFDTLVPNMWKYALAVGICLTIWLLIWIYLTYTAGWVTGENGEPMLYLNHFDKWFLEFFLLLWAGLVYAVIQVVRMGKDILVNGLGENAKQVFVFSRAERWYLYGAGAVCGFLASMGTCILWYSLVRRIKCHSLWRDSLACLLFHHFYKGASMVFYHKNVATRTLIPFNLYLFTNVMGLALLSLFRDQQRAVFFLLLGILVFNALVGVWLFRSNAEMAEIVDAIKRIRKGEVDYQLDGDKMHGENKEIAEAVNNIGEGIRKAVETSVKDERMKSDLITNVSHDIKTPLTSIINYVDLLKREKIESEPARSYIQILEAKSLRLKQLTDDLVEASKISSGNIEYQREPLNVVELLNQSVGEFSEKFEAQNLKVILEAEKKEEAVIYADSRRMWRIIENLFHNICKYAMPSTRVYLETDVEDEAVVLTMKNISQVQLQIRTEDLTERFIRGDVSRTTEGSGLGLFIAKSLTQAQGGSLQVALDGDLFKVRLEFPRYRVEP